MKKLIPENILIKRCLKGDTKAEFELFCNYAKAMTNVSMRITGNSFDAEEVVQDAFIIAFKKLKSFKGQGTFGSWLKRIVVNESLGFLRKHKINYESLPEYSSAIEEEVEMDEMVNMNEVMTAINNLPDGARVVFCLKAIEEYKMAEIADMLNLSISNVKVQYHRAKLLLREKLVHKMYVD